MFKEVDDRDLFDGHMQGHCGWHLYVSGTDKAKVDEAFGRLRARGVKQSNGTCSCGKAEPPYTVTWGEQENLREQARLWGTKAYEHLLGKREWRRWTRFSGDGPGTLSETEAEYETVAVMPAIKVDDGYRVGDEPLIGQMPDAGPICQGFRGDVVIVSVPTGAVRPAAADC